MKTTNQNYTTPPRSKRRGFIRLGLLCLLSAIVAPFQSFAQGIPTVNPGDGNLPVVMELKGLSTRLIRTKWQAVQAFPSTVKNGQIVTLTGQLVYERSSGFWLGLGGRNVTVQVGRGQITPLRTNGNGVATHTFRVFDPDVANGKFPRGKRVSFRFTYGGDKTYGFSIGMGSFLLMP